jgi:outer membrane scaffolding protein for murein synthesis (MipA/OmpV family)
MLEACWRTSAPGSAKRIAWLATMVCCCASHVACAQTPSPIQEWQYPGGIILEQLFGQTPKWRRILGVAASVEPVYEGARAYRLSGGPVINLYYRNIAFISAGEGIGVNLIHAAHFRAGVAVGYDLGRSASSDFHLRGLPDIDPAAVPKVFAEWALSRHFPLILRADIRRVIRHDDGYVGDAEAYVPLPGSSRRFVMFAGASYTFADRSHMQELFGITPLQAQSAELPIFTAHGGADAEGAGFSATLLITSHWLMNMDAAVSRLLGSASQSPIAERRVQRALDVATAYQW